ncbi:MAG: hypothetical protein M0P12_11630 [Paludibacteraceae bacterium]|nr:hypothetical protein [Paludibacteraceae bacterium]MCK9616031.1 hypothetical protein [Candidatus Omnitrophota bacterium]
MGIRIHKEIGWVITDLKKNDPRVNWEVVKTFWSKTEKDLKDFQNWIKEQDKTVKGRHGMNHLSYKIDEDLRLSSFVFYDEERFKKTILIGDGWANHTRWDDDIDYIEDYLKRGNGKKQMGDSIRILKDGYYPYQQFWMFAETGEYLYPVQRCDGVFYFGSEKLNKRFKDIPQEELNRLIVPQIPLVVSDICEFFDVFIDKKTKLQLRPALATYWS